MEEAFRDFLDSMVPIAAKMLREARARPRAQIRITRVLDGLVYVWDGPVDGVACVCRDLWPAFCKAQEDGELPWGLCVMAIDTNFYYVMQYPT